eukprot:scaffold5610_cov137-Isochrysis_galbana.AAC.11
MRLTIAWGAPSAGSRKDRMTHHFTQTFNHQSLDVVGCRARSHMYPSPRKRRPEEETGWGQKKGEGRGSGGTVWDHHRCDELRQFRTNLPHLFVAAVS